MNPPAGLPRPGPVHGAYPMRQAGPAPVWSDLADQLGDRLTARGTRWRQCLRRFDAAFAAPGDGAPATHRGTVCAARGDTAFPPGDTAPPPHDPALADLTSQAAHAARRLAREGFSPEAVALAQRVAAAAVHRTLGLQPYATQLHAALALLSGRLVEMDTGEGKSLAILLAAASAGLARVPTHVITANEYLAVRDAAAAARVLKCLGLRVAAIRAEMGPPERRAAYACDVVYATAQEIGFDFLRDRLTPDEPVLRGLCLALVDEADSVLLDHAQTPLVLSEHGGDALDAAAAAAAWHHTGVLRPGLDFRLQRQERTVDILPAVFNALPPALAALPDRRLQTAALRDGLVARLVLQRDVHYLIDDNEVVLLDQNTGRKLPGTVWSRGLQQMVHLKEGLPAPQAIRTAQRITLQTLLGRYLRLAGISGTLRESRGPLWFFYRLPVCRIAPRQPPRRRPLGTRVFTQREQQLDALARRVREVARAGRPVLVGTDSVAAADALSDALQRRGVVHRLLTARDDRQEAALIASAGAPGTVTVATHIAGRGTDIDLPPAALRAGGLHVICCAQSNSGRIDRQLFGRAARNGRPGSCETLLSLEDPVFATVFPALAISLLNKTADTNGSVPARWSRRLPALVHALKSWGEFLRSYQLVRQDRLVRAALVFAPHSE